MILLFLFSLVKADIFNLSDESSIKFSVLNYKIKKDVYGTFHNFKGVIYTKKDSNFTFNIEINSCSVKIKDKEALKQLNKILDCKNYPKINIKSIFANENIIKGNLLIKNSLRPILFQIISREVNEKLIKISAKAIIDRYNFGLFWNTYFDDGGFLIDNEVSIYLDLIGHHSS